METGKKLAMRIPPSGRRQWIMGVAAAAAGGFAGPTDALGDDANGVSHTAEAIRQEILFKANLKRVYAALTDAQQFQKVELLSSAVRSMDLVSKPAEISREPGGAFSIFGSYIVGRQIELIPNQRIVQAWRVMSWDTGVYSMARFELTEQESGTKLVFDQTGFPAGDGEHLAAGWKANYWEPLEKFLG